MGSQTSLSARYRVANGEWRFYRLQLHFVVSNSSGELLYKRSLNDLWSEWLAESLSGLEDDSVIAECEADWTVKTLDSVRDVFSGASSKKWFQTHGVPPWLRGHWPVLCYQEEVVALLGQHGKLNKYFEVMPVAGKGHCFLQNSLQKLTVNQLLIWLR